MVQTQSAEFDVSSAGADLMNSLGSSLGQLCVGSRATQLELPLLADLNPFASGCPVLMSTIARDTHTRSKSVNGIKY